MSATGPLPGAADGSMCRHCNVPVDDQVLQRLIGKQYFQLLQLMEVFEIHIYRFRFFQNFHFVMSLIGPVFRYWRIPLQRLLRPFRFECNAGSL